MMKFSDEKPARPGFYWRKLKNTNETTVVEIFTGYYKTLHVKDGGEDYALSESFTSNFEWAGPLIPPEE